MDQFNIFLDFYRVIAEMTEEEIVSAISNGKVPEHSRKRATHLRGTRRESSQRREEETATESPSQPTIGEDAPTRPSSSIWDIS